MLCDSSTLFHFGLNLQSIFIPPLFMRDSCTVTTAFCLFFLGLFTLAAIGSDDPSLRPPVPEQVFCSLHYWFVC